MSTIPHGPDPSFEFDDSPPPGGARRFLLALIAALLLLGGVVLGMLYWLRATSNPDYRGPEQLKKPDYPYYQ